LPDFQKITVVFLHEHEFVALRTVYYLFGKLHILSCFLVYDCCRLHGEI